MKKADYSKIANTYDDARVRILSDKSIELCLEMISKRVDRRKRVELLDLGCGTGKFAMPIADKLGYTVTGVDSSKEMISKAKAKDTNQCIKWSIEDAERLPHADCSFDVVFISHLLHHIDDPVRVIRESFRVLRPNGLLVNRYGAIDHIRNDPEHIFSPETLQFDEERTPSIAQIEKWFKEVGFGNVSTETIDQYTCETASERLHKDTLKSTSVLHLISESVFNDGLQRLKKYVEEHPEDPWLLIDKITMTTGTKY